MMTGSKPLVMMMAGGTGGHVYPALAVATELLSRGYRVEWIGTARGLEHRVVPAAGIVLHCLSVRGVRGKNALHKLLALSFLMLASLQALWLVLRRAPACVIGMGGYGRVVVAQTTADPRTKCSGRYYQPYAGTAGDKDCGRFPRRFSRGHCQHRDR
jgi:UDP-N-acetylglucosamine:LPS N-acetylglucosamine transferase